MDLFKELISQLVGNWFVINAQKCMGLSLLFHIL